MKVLSNFIARTSFLSLVTFLTSQCINREAKAEFVSASSGGYGAQVDVGVAGLLTTNLLALTPSQVSNGSGPPNYNQPSGLVNLNLNSATVVPGIANLTLANVTGVAESRAFSTFSPELTQNSTIGEGGVANLSLGIGRVQVLGSGEYAISINASVLNSSSTIAGQSASINVDGVSTFENLSISVLGNALNLAEFGTITGQQISFAPNTFIGLNAFGLAGAGLYLNEQVKSSDVFGNFSISTNALRLDLDAVSLAGGVGLLNGEVVLGHSQANIVADISAVPEPGSLLVLCAAGATFFGFKRRRKISSPEVGGKPLVEAAIV